MIIYVCQRSYRENAVLVEPTKGSECLTGDTLIPMAQVTVRELRNHGGDVIDRVLKGERIIVTRSGRTVAELQPLRRKSPDPATLLDRWRHLPPVDPVSMRRDIDEIIDPSL